MGHRCASVCRCCRLRTAISETCTITSIAPCAWHTGAALCKCDGAFVSPGEPRAPAPMWPRMNVTVSLNYCELSNLEGLLTLAEYMIAHSEYGDDRSLKAQDLNGLRSAQKIFGRLSSAMRVKA